MSNIFAFWSVFLLLLHYKSIAFIHYTRFRANRVYDDMRFRKDDVFQVATNSKTRCATLCSMKSECVAFNRKMRNERLFWCQIIVVPVTNILTNSAHIPGWRFYENVSHILN